MRGELPLEYHALSIAQDKLRIAKRRDAAHAVPFLPARTFGPPLDHLMGDPRGWLPAPASIDKGLPVR